MATVIPDDNRNARTGMMAFGLALAMLGMGYAAVPLYEIFCRVTGFGGTTQVATEGEAAAAAQLAQGVAVRDISVRFDASTARNVPWAFQPAQSTDTVQIGQRDMAFYTAKNNSGVPITGTATFNVEPEYAGKYFNKIQCFCFTEQTLQPGQEVRMPVLYFIDPAILQDKNAADLEQITLSYTFHKKIEEDS